MSASNFYYGLVLLFVICACSPNTPLEEAAEEEAIIVGYVMGSRMAETNPPIAMELMTHINYAFADVVDGQVVEISPKDSANMAYLNSLRTQNEDLQILISIGGWTRSGGFSDAVLTSQSRAIFANSCLDFMLKHHLDGIDLDWEYPGLPGNGNTHRPEDKENFTAALALLRQKLDSLGTLQDREYLLTIATAANQSYLDNIEMDQIHPFLDFMNIMTYDFFGGWSSQTGHHTNLYRSEYDSTTLQRSADKAVQQHLEAGAPASKLVLGVAFYGRGWQEVTSQNKGLYQEATGNGFSLSFAAIQDSISTNEHYQRHWDTSASAPFVWHTTSQSFITYDSPESLKEKSAYIKQKGLKGAMFWEYHADTKELVLLRTLNQSLR